MRNHIVKHVPHEERLDLRIGARMAVPPAIGKVKYLEFLDIQLGRDIQDLFDIDRDVFVEVLLILVTFQVLEGESFH